MIERSFASILPALAVCALAAAPLAAGASTLQTLHAFCAKSNCSDGAQPVGGLIRDAAGNFFGVTLGGGANGTAVQSGTVFEMIPDQGTWKEKVIHSFCFRTNCKDGRAPDGQLIADTVGNLYGTASLGGRNDGGVVFRLTRNAMRNKWRYKVLYHFCSAGGSDCTDGRHPNGALTYQGAASGAPYDGTSPLYGITGPWAADAGKIFALTPGGDGTWSETVVHSFCAETGCADGSNPDGELLLDASGNIYGTTYAGGTGDGGVAFEMTHAARDGWSETVLYLFCSKASCADGRSPTGNLVMDATGALYGTTSAGGAHHDGGTLFKLVPGGSSSTETVLYDFCAQAKCADGWIPGALTMDSSGAIFGATGFGGAHGSGTLFKYDGTHQTLYDFCVVKKCADGRYPSGPTFTDLSGNMFGVTVYGGGNDYLGDNTAGIVYELSP